jgi:hypothetical protein
MQSSREKQFTDDRAVATEWLAAAVAESKAINDETERLRSIQVAINAEVANRDRDWERRQWFVQNVDSLVAWTAGSGSLPKMKALDTSEYEARVFNVALEQVVLKLMAMQAAAYASRSEELECQSRLKHIDALEAHFKTEEFMKSGAEIMGEDARVDVKGSVAEKLQKESDELLMASNHARQRAMELVGALPKTRKGN